jgi:molybdate transport system substrate-binding protein
MITCTRKRLLLALPVVTILAWLVVAPVTTAQQPSLLVFASDAVQAAMQALQPQLQAEIGRPIAIRFGTSASLQRSIQSGDAFDVAILATSAMRDLQTDKKVEPAVALARTGIGIGIRAGGPRPEIDTPDALKRTLLSIKSLVYVREGASRTNIEQLFERLGIAREMALKTVLQPGFEQMGQSIVQGQAEFVLLPTSELTLMPGVEVLGPLPAELQSYIELQVSVSAAPRNGEAAHTLVRLLKAPSVVAVFKSKGLEIP